jgi:hypothetical protein
VAACGAAWLFGCQLVFPTVATESGATDGGHHPDVTSSSTDASDPYNDIRDPANWEAYDLHGSAPSFNGGTFDGRYVYLSPFAGPAARFDTHAPFRSAASWESFPLTHLTDAGANSLLITFGAVYDGRYVYFVPYGGDLPHAIAFARYDTHGGAFTDESAWETFDATKALGSSVQAFEGAVFDGRYVYFVPLLNGTIARYDTTTSFHASTSWSLFDLTTVNPGASGFVGGVYDGRYMYLVPDENGVTYLSDGGSEGEPTPDGLVMRYDTKAPLSDKAAWDHFDVSMLMGSSTAGFAGGAYDGQYLYLAPGSSSGLVPRVPTTSFLDAGAWSTFATTALSSQARGYFGAGYDGRFIYMVPLKAGSSFDGLVVRYDTQQSFAEMTSWSSHDVQKQFGVTAVQFIGAVFDGEYMYFVPGGYTTVVRFHARSPRATPSLPFFHGSFL